MLNKNVFAKVMLLAITVVFTLLIGCKKELVDNTDAENAVSMSGEVTELKSSQKRRARGDLFPSDQQAARQLRRFNKLIEGQITEAEFGAKGVDTALWLIEGLVNVQNPIPNREAIAVESIDSIEVPMMLLNSFASAAEMKSVYNALNAFIQSVDTNTNRRAAVFADIETGLDANGINVLKFKAVKIVIITDRCTLPLNACIKVSTNRAIEGGCPPTPQLLPIGHTFGRILTGRCSPILPVGGFCKYYTSVVTVKVGRLFDPAIPSIKAFDGECICNPKLQQELNRAISLANTSKPAGMIVISVAFIPHNYNCDGIVNGCVFYDIQVTYGYCRDFPND